MSGDECTGGRDCPVHFSPLLGDDPSGAIIFDPNPVDPAPTGASFEVGDRIQIGQHIVTVTAVIPHKDDATEYRIEGFGDDMPVVSS